MPSRDEIKSAIVEFLKQLSPQARDYKLVDSTNFVQAGLLDSFALLEMVAKLEERFAVSMDIAAFDFETFTTIGGLCDAVQAHLG